MLTVNQCHNRCKGKSQETGIERAQEQKGVYTPKAGARENPKKRELKVVVCRMG